MYIVLNYFVYLQQDRTSMNKNKLHLYERDIILSIFTNEPGGLLTYERFSPHAQMSPDYDEVVASLTEEGYLKECRYGFNITAKGRAVYNDGGFVAKHRRKQREHVLVRAGIIIGIITGVSSLILSIIALTK